MRILHAILEAAARPKSGLQTVTFPGSPFAPVPGNDGLETGIMGAAAARDERGAGSGKRASERDGGDSASKRQRAGGAAADRAAAGGAAGGGSSQMTERRYQTFQNMLAGARGEEMEPSMSKDDALRAVAAGSAESFEEDEMDAYLARMVEENMLMMSRGKLFFV